jgi:hypothetical protein
MIHTATTSKDPFMRNLEALALVAMTLTFVPLFLVLRNLAVAARCAWRAETLVFDREARALHRNGKRIADLASVREVHLRRTARSSEDESECSYTYRTWVKLQGRKKLPVGDEEVDRTGARALARAVARVCGVRLETSSGIAVNFRVGD